MANLLINRSVMSVFMHIKSKEHEIIFGVDKQVMQIICQKNASINLSISEV
ncbi:hypothetical protein THZB04_90036 [Vibrio owensii]|nr:hypothetical protein THZB04_90036 [Vibrio owensii]